MKNIIGLLIKKEREIKELSQTELGITALNFKRGDENKAQKVISKIETGKRDVSANELYSIAKYFKKSLYYFFGHEEKEVKEQNNFMCGWSPEEIDYCQKLKKVLENKEDGEIVKKMIDAYADKYKTKKTRKKGTLKPTGT